MTADTAVAVPIGHNNPPDPIAELQTKLAEVAAANIKRKDDLLAGVARAPAVIDDEDVCGKMSDFVKQITGAHKTTEALRVAQKEPHLAASRAVDGFFRPILDELDKARKTIEKRLTVYQQKKADEERRRREEEARQAREAARQAEEEAQARLAEAIRQEEERKRAEADIAAANPGFVPPDEDPAELAAALAAEEEAARRRAEAEQAAKAVNVKAADLSRTRGTYGAVSSLRTEWTFKDLDRETLDLQALRAHLPQEALEKAVRAFIKAGGRELAGVTIYEETKTVVR